MGGRAYDRSDMEDCPVMKSIPATETTPGPVAVITGGGTGVGRSAALSLAAEGWSLVLAGRRPEALEQTLGLAAEAGLDPERGLAVVADVGVEADVLALFDQVEQAHGRIDLLFNNAGTGAPPKPFDELTLDDWQRVVDKSCPVDNCCDGKDCPPAEHANHHTTGEKLWAGLKYTVDDLWGDLAGWFFIGLLLAGIISALIPPELMTRYLGGGLHAMLIMLLVGIPMYICATASTPVAAALILKGVSPGAALVFLLVGPATNVTSLSVLFGILGKRATAIYLVTLSVFAVLSGLILDQIYGSFGISAQAIAGQAGEVIPYWMQLGGAIIVILLSIKPLHLILRNIFSSMTC